MTLSSLPGFPSSLTKSGIFSALLLLAARAFVFPEISSVPEGSRPYGMGNAFTAVANDFNSIYFNPAGLANVSQIEAALGAGRFLTSNDSPQTEVQVSGAFPLQYYRETWSSGTMGVLAHRAGRVGDRDVTTFAVGLGAKPALPRRIAVITAPEGFRVGCVLRARQVRKGASSGIGPGIDLGFLYRFDEGKSSLRTGWSLGLAIQEVNAPSVSSAVRYRLGAAWRQPLSVLALDLVVENGVSKFFPGLELTLFRKLLSVRVGSGEIPGEPRQFTLGLGTLLPPLQFDLAYGFPTNDSRKANDRILFTMVYRFGSPFLTQYFYQERLEKINEVENKVANLEGQKKTIQASIQEQKDLYDLIQTDVKQTREKNADMFKEFKKSGELLADRKKEIEKLEEEIRVLKNKKEQMEEKKTPKVAAEVSGPKKHKVMPGDSLRSLAEKYYNDPKKWQLIYEANENKIIRGVPKEGEELVIP